MRDDELIITRLETSNKEAIEKYVNGNIRNGAFYQRN